LACAILFDEKISQRAALFWFELQNVGISSHRYSTHGPSSKEQLLTPSYFWSPVCVESLAVDPVEYTKDFSFIKGA
jgi:hypothetical protein